jgi:GT2 family glycosyltransferase
MPDVSVIIVNHNTVDLLSACLASLFAGEPTLPMEVIVVDNGSTDGSVEMVRRDFQAVHLILNATNEGFARPNNAAMRVGTGRHFFLLNSDTEMIPGALTELVRFLDAHPEAGACGPKLVYPDGRLQYSIKGFPTLWTHFCDMTFLDKIFPRWPLFGRGEMRYYAYERSGEVDHVMAAAFLVRREVVDDIGLLDERFSIYYNDMDWCYRMVRRGWKVFYVATAQVIHHHGMTSAKINRNFAYFEELYSNIMLFYQKHYGRLSVVGYRLLLFPGFVVRTIGWSILSLLKPSERAAHMLTFSRKTLALAARFWKPYAEVERVARMEPS